MKQKKILLYHASAFHPVGVFACKLTFSQRGYGTCGPAGARGGHMVLAYQWILMALLSAQRRVGGQTPGASLQVSRVTVDHQLDLDRSSE